MTWFAALLLLALPPVPDHRDADARMATVAYRLATGNAALCRDLQPTPGFQLHAADQYAGAARSAFARPIQVLAVAPGSPAALADVVPTDSLIEVEGRAVPEPAAGRPTSATRDAAATLIAAHSATAPLRVTVERAGVRREVVLPANPGCRSAFEVLLGPGLKARSDGRVVQVGVAFFERFDDEAIAAVVAHELAHTVLRHRARLEAAGVRWGLFAPFGRNARLFRATEEEADRLSVHLLRNAGYDPRAAVRFWRDHGGKIDGGPFRSATHPPAKARAAAMEAEIAAMAAGPSLSPAILAARDRPL